MRAVLRKTLTLKTDYKEPECSSSNLRVQIKAAAINPVDYKLGWPIFGPISGLDFAGVVDQVGQNVKDFKVGDEVYGMADGSLADYAVVRPDKISHKPKSLTFPEAAALPVAYLTSYQALRVNGSLEGRKVIVIGASGGCGIAGVQLAKLMGASKIYGVCSGKNADLVKSLGVDEVIDYTKQNLLEYFKVASDDLSDEDKIDLIYDTATGSGGGEDYLAQSKPLLFVNTERNGTSRDGQYVAINGGPSRWARAFTIGLPKNEHLITTKSTREEFGNLADLIDTANQECEEGQCKEEIGLKPVIKNCYAFTQENVTEAFELLKSRRAVGKLVFDMSK